MLKKLYIIKKRGVEMLKKIDEIEIITRDGKTRCYDVSHKNISTKTAVFEYLQEAGWRYKSIKVISAINNNLKQCLFIINRKNSKNYLIY